MSLWWSCQSTIPDPAPPYAPLSQNLTRTQVAPCPARDFGPGESLISDMPWANRIRKPKWPMCMVLTSAYSHSPNVTKTSPKEADTFRLSLFPSIHPPSHRSASMTARLVLCICVVPNGSCRPVSPREEEQSLIAKNVERAQLLNGARRHRPLFVDQDLAVGWELIPDTHYPFQTKCLPSLCHPWFPGAGSRHTPTHTQHHARGKGE